jgi:RhtB (resistance to homoserine/threonine) family protein
MFIARIFSIALISLLAAMSPGPDFAIVVKTALSGSFRKAFLTSLGVAVALVVHISYCMFGIALIIVQSPLLYSIITYSGACYLFYLGVGLLREKTKNPELKKVKEAPKQNPFLAGFFCNILNPKATLFVLSLFSQFITPEMHLAEKVLFATIFPVIVLIWFSTLSFLITHHLVQKHFMRLQKSICKVMGAILCFLAFFVVLQHLSA